MGEGTRARRGFTLMEMLIVVAIISVLVAIAIPTFSDQLARAREATDDANCRSAVALCSAECMATCDGDFSAKTDEEWADYAIAGGIPQTGKVDSSAKLSATIGDGTISFAYGSGEGTPAYGDSLTPNASSVSSAVISLIKTTTGNGSNIPTSSYQGTSYAYIDMSFNYGYSSIGGKKVSDYLAEQDLSDDVATLRNNGYTIVFTGSGSVPGSVRGYYYTSPDDASKMVVVSGDGSTQLVDKVKNASQGYYGSLM